VVSNRIYCIWGGVLRYFLRKLQNFSESEIRDRFFNAPFNPP
jgi:hypothetical protein